MFKKKILENIKKILENIEKFSSFLFCFRHIRKRLCLSCLGS
jgi:hypothetical protein